MITLIPAGNPGPFTGPAGNNTWLIDGAEPLLVDAGVGAPSHIAALEGALAGRPLARVFLTHAHYDHAAGVPRLRERWPQLEVIDAGGRITIAAGDGDVEVIPTPGHSRDHGCLWDAKARVLFAGDLIQSGGTIMIAASSGGSLRGYLASLARVRGLRPARIYPGHGPVIDNGEALIDQYIAHRLERERQVLSALERGAINLDSLVGEIYPELAEALAPAARDTLLAHLRKLEEEGRAAEAAGVWSLPGPAVRAPA